jgi:HD-like signal output (HDOD) protein
MTDRVDKERIVQELLLSKPIDIPVFHEVALRLQQMMIDHSYRTEDAITLVNEDTALAAEMLRQANTAYYSGKTPITTIKNAIIRLGSQQVVNLAFTASMANSKSDNPLINKYFENLWHHSHAVAIVSAWLAVEVRNTLNVNADEVYLAGLFHAIGKLYLLKCLDKLIKTGKLVAEENIIDDILNEMSVQQGIKVMQYWNIPEIYTNSVGRLNTNNWKCGTNDHLVAAVRLSCKVHQYYMKIFDESQLNEASILLEDELTLLNIEDVKSVFNMIRAILD